MPDGHRCHQRVEVASFLDVQIAEDGVDIPVYLFPGEGGAGRVRGGAGQHRVGAGAEVVGRRHGQSPARQLGAAPGARGHRGVGPGLGSAVHNIPE